MEEFINSLSGIEGEQLDLVQFTIRLLISALLSFLLSVAYVQFGRSLSNRKIFSSNFILITVTTTLIITIVKSSVMLSLGLVGALSIVRFRTAIKEPEELSYIFLSISIGLGIGAGMIFPTTIGFLVSIIIILFRGLLLPSSKTENLYLTVSSFDPNSVNLDSIVSLLQKYCSRIDLKRFDENNELLEASFLVEYKSFDSLSKSKEALRTEFPGINVSFLDNKGIF